MQHIYRVFGLFMSVLGLIPVVSLASLPNELPKALAENLKSPQSHVVIRYDWPVLMSDPLFVEFLDLYSNENETDIPHLEILWGSAAQSVTRSRLDPTIIDSAWVTMHSLSAKHSATFWALTTLPTDVLRQKLNTSGLVATPDNEHVFGPVPDEQADPDDYRRYTSADPEQQEVLLKRFMQWKWRILILDGGWVTLLSPGTQPEPYIESSILVPTPDSEDEDGPRFPFSMLLTSDESATCAMAIDIPENDPPAESTKATADTEPQDPIKSEIRELRTRLRELEGLTSSAPLSQIGDLFITASEIDGGHAYDILARRPGGKGEDQTPRFLRATTTALAIASIHASPDLTRELGHITIRTYADEVRATTIVSTATLHDAIRNDSDRQGEKAELRRRILELEKSNTIER